MRMATKTPSEWLRLLCRDWSLENESIVAATDARFLHYKSYLKGQLTSQLLCRLSISGDASHPKEHRDRNDLAAVLPAPPPAQTSAIDFWKILGVDDAFDRAHVVANIERFCSLYNIRGGTLDEPAGGPVLGYDNATTAAVWNHYSYPDVTVPHSIDPATAAAAAAAAGMAAAPPGHAAHLYTMDPIDAAASVAAKPQQHQHQHQHQHHHDGLPPPRKMLPPSNPKTKTQERRLKAEMREREREAYSRRKAAEKAARLGAREERRARKLAMRRQREEYARQQKEEALRRAAELVRSNRVPIEITRGAAAAQAAANAAAAQAAVPAAERAAFAATEEAMAREAAATAVQAQQVVTVPQAAASAMPAKKGRSRIVISTASDLDQIVTHSNNLWAKYNAIAKEHNQKVNWIVVAKELGIHVKVREKYARMHARAKSRGFDFVNWGHYRIKDYPQFFLDPLGPVVPATAAGEEPAKILEEAGGGGGGGKQSWSLEGGPLQEQQVHAQPDSLNGVHKIPHRDMVSLAAEVAGVVGNGSVPDTAAPEAPAKIVEEPIAGNAKRSWSLEGGALREVRAQPVLEAVALGQPDSLNDVHEIPNRDVMSLAAEVAGVVGDGSGYSDDPAVVAAAAAVQQHPTQVSGDEALHVVPPLPQGNDNMPHDEMKIEAKLPGNADV